MAYLNSTKAEQLYSNTHLLGRVKFIMLRCAAKFLKEDGDVPHHAARANYARHVLYHIDDEARRVTLAGLAVADLPDEVHSAISNSSPEDLVNGKVLSHESLDQLFIGLIENGWNTFAGVIENPATPN